MVSAPDAAAIAAVSSEQLSATTINRSPALSSGRIERSVASIIDASLCAGTTIASLPRAPAFPEWRPPPVTASNTSIKSTATGSSSSSAAPPRSISIATTKFQLRFAGRFSARGVADHPAALRFRALAARTPYIEGKQFVAGYRLERRTPVAARERMIAVVNYMHAAVITKALHCRSRLKFEQIHTRFAAREYENHAHTPRCEILELPPKIHR